MDDDGASVEDEFPEEVPAPPGPAVPAVTPPVPDAAAPDAVDDAVAPPVALAWNAAKVLLAVGLMANTIPDAVQ